MNTLSDLLVSTIPQYEVILPSTGKKVKFRPFLVKEEKVLLIAQSTGNNQQVLDAIKNIIESCFEDINDASSLPLFDVEYLFLKLRSKSVGEVVTPTIICPFTNEKIELNINLDKIEVTGEIKRENKIKIKPKLIVKMSYPSLKTLSLSDNPDYNSPESIYDLIVNCIDQVITEEETINTNEISKDEVSSFVDNMTKNQFGKLVDFITSIPRLKHTEKYKTSDEVEREVVLSSLSDFFG
mgnify:FL=1